METRAQSNQASPGFSLLEVVVSLAILSISGSVIYGIFSAGLGQAAHAEDYTRALLLAESTIARLGVDLPVGFEGYELADHDGFVPRVRSRLVPDSELPTGQLLAEVTVSVSWGDGRRTVDLRTLRLVEASE